MIDRYQETGAKYSSRAQLRATLSGGRIKEPAAPDVATETAMWVSEKTGRQIVSYVPPGSIEQLQNARDELHKTMISNAFTIALAKDDLVKQMQCPLKDSTGITSVVVDSNATSTPYGQAFSPPQFPITARGSRLTYRDIMDEQNVSEPSPSPAVVSGQTNGQSDWSPDTANGDYDANPRPWDADKAKSNLLTHYTKKDGTISGYAKRYFLNVLGDGSEPNPDNFQIPLGQINAAQQPYYDSDALLEGWKHAAGIYNGAANRNLQLRMVRIMHRNGFTLTPEMQQFATNHMGEPAPDDDEDNQEEDNHNE